jgi:hypothetical protein
MGQGAGFRTGIRCHCSINIRQPAAFAKIASKKTEKFLFFRNLTPSDVFRLSATLLPLTLEVVQLYFTLLSKEGRAVSPGRIRKPSPGPLHWGGSRCQQIYLGKLSLDSKDV